MKEQQPTEKTNLCHAGLRFNMATPVLVHLPHSYGQPCTSPYHYVHRTPAGGHATRKEQIQSWYRLQVSEIHNLFKWWTALNIIERNERITAHWSLLTLHMDNIWRLIVIILRWWWSSIKWVEDIHTHIWFILLNALSVFLRTQLKLVELFLKIRWSKVIKYINHQFIYQLSNHGCSIL